MKKRSLKIMSVVLAGVMTTGMILGGCSAGGDKENGGNKEASKELNLWMHNGQAFVDETKKLAENYEKETGVKIKSFISFQKIFLCFYFFTVSP